MNSKISNFIGFLRGIKFKLRCWKIYGDTRRKIQQMFFAGKEITVMDGPFHGMRFLNEPVWGPITPKWLGTYEAPLFAALNEIFNIAPEIVIDVGCAEGYYAAGYAYRLKNSVVHAFDADLGSMRQTKKLARLNGIQDRVIVRNWCHHENIRQLSEGRTTLVFCDIEGGEQFLLDPAACPALKLCAILVEIHPLDGSISEMSDLLRRRFESSHQIQQIDDTRRSHGDFPLIPKELSPALFEQASEEGRPWQQQWLWMRPNRA